MRHAYLSLVHIVAPQLNSTAVSLSPRVIYFSIRSPSLKRAILVFVCVCLWLCSWVFVCVCLGVCASMCVCVCRRAWLRVCLFMCTCACACSRACVHVHVHLGVFACACEGGTHSIIHCVYSRIRPWPRSRV